MKQLSSSLIYIRHLTLISDTQFTLRAWFWRQMLALPQPPSFDSDTRFMSVARQLDSRRVVYVRCPVWQQASQLRSGTWFYVRHQVYIRYLVISQVSGTSLLFKWLRHWASTAGSTVKSLVRELRVCTLHTLYPPKKKVSWFYIWNLALGQLPHFYVWCPEGFWFCFLSKLLLFAVNENI